MPTSTEWRTPPYHWAATAVSRERRPIRPHRLTRHANGANGTRANTTS